MDKEVYIIIGVVIVLLLVYIGISIFLNKLNKAIYKKGTIMAFLPIFNVYLLGKLTVNKIVGCLLVIATFITGSFTSSFNGNENSYTLLPNSVSVIISSITSVMVIVLFVFAIIKYSKLKDKKIKEKIVENETDNDIKGEKPELLDSLDEVKEVKKTFIPFFEEEVVNTIHPLLQDKKNDEFAIPDAIEISKNEGINNSNVEDTISELANNCNNIITNINNEIENNNQKVTEEFNGDFDDFFENKISEEEDGVPEQSIPVVEPAVIEEVPVENNYIPYEEIKTIPEEDIVVIEDESNRELTADDILDIDIPDKDEQIDDIENISINNNLFEDNNDDFIPDMIN